MRIFHRVSQARPIIKLKIYLKGGLYSQVVIIWYSKEKYKKDSAVENKDKNYSSDTITVEERYKERSSVEDKDR